MVVEIFGVEKLVDVDRRFPPVATSYQTTFPLLADANKVPLPVPQRLAGVVPDIAGTAFILASTVVRAEEQDPFVAST